MRDRLVEATVIMILCRAFLLFLAFSTAIFTSPAFSQSPGSTAMTASKRPRIALALSGGGARGLAHIGVLRVLKEMRVPVDIVVGPGFDSAAHPVLVFSYDADSGSFVKRAVLVGDAAFGSSLAGVSGSVRGVAGHRTELIVGSQSAGSIFSFR